MSEDFPTLDLPIKAYSGSPVVGHLFTRLLLMTNSAEVMTIVTILCYTKLFYRTKIRHCKHIAQTGKKWLGERESGKGSHGEEEGKESKPIKKRTEGQARRGKKGKQKWVAKQRKGRAKPSKKREGGQFKKGKKGKARTGNKNKGKKEPSQGRKRKKAKEAKERKRNTQGKKARNPINQKGKQEIKKERNQEINPLAPPWRYPHYL